MSPEQTLAELALQTGPLGTLIVGFGLYISGLVKSLRVDVRDMKADQRVARDERVQLRADLETLKGAVLL